MRQFVKCIPVLSLSTTSKSTAVKVLFLQRPVSSVVWSSCIRLLNRYFASIKAAALLPGRNPCPYLVRRD